MDRAEHIIARFLHQFGVFSGSPDSPVGEFTSLNVQPTDMPRLLEQFGDTDACEPADQLAGHYLGRRVEGQLTVTRFGDAESLAEVQRQVHTEYRTWEGDNAQSTNTA